MVSLAFVMAACSGASSGELDGPAATSTVAQASTTVTSTQGTVAGPSTTQSPTTRPAPDPSRPLAPQFTLTLGDGTVYRSADDVRPIYLVFWAEW